MVFSVIVVALCSSERINAAAQAGPKVKLWAAIGVAQPVFQLHETENMAMSFVVVNDGESWPIRALNPPTCSSTASSRRTGALSSATDPETPTLKLFLQGRSCRSAISSAPGTFPRQEYTLFDGKDRIINPPRSPFE